MAIAIRRAEMADAAECGRIICAAFAVIADQHNFRMISRLPRSRSGSPRC